MHRRLKTRNVLVSGLCALLLVIGIQTQLPAQEIPPVIGLSELTRLDHLPRLKTSVKVGSFSSYDRTGGNDDGFSGKYSFVRKEGDALVLADLQGPGVITRIWTPTPTDDPMEFYFDGEAQPRLKLTFRQLFDGTTPPFTAPLSSFGSGGFVTYLPMPFKTSCKVLIRAPKVQFYQINYALYPAGTSIETFSPTSPDITGAKFQEAQKLLGMSGQDISAYVVPENTRLKTTKKAHTLKPGETVKVFETKRGGRIAGLRLGPASAFAGKDRAILLKITFDGDSEPAVLAPVGDFFGYSWGDPAARSLLVGTEDNTCYTYFPMPFDRSVRIELISEKPSGSPLSIQSEVITADLPRRPDEGKFYAIWHRESPTTKGKPFNFVETQGRGHVVGVALQAQGSVPGITPFFEGDDQATLDGELTIHGTGSEDFFNGGWYDVPGRWEARASYPLSGCLDYIRAQARSGAYRLFLTDAYAFRRNVKLDIEHAPTNNDFDADYAGMAYLYLENRPTTPWTVPPQTARAVHDPDRLVYAPGWYMPLHAFSMERATLAKKVERHNNREDRFLAMRAEGEDVFGQHSISFLCAIPAAGRYRVSIEAMNGPEQGVVQLFQNERAAGDKADFYAEKRDRSKMISMGELQLREGQNQVFFKIVGKNDKATALGFDIVTLVLERIP